MLSRVGDKARGVGSFIEMSSLIAPPLTLDSRPLSEHHHTSHFRSSQLRHLFYSHCGIHTAKCINPDQALIYRKMAENTIIPTHAYTLPRVTIQFCTQCKWLLRAAYVCSYSSRQSMDKNNAYIKTQYAQELLSTFSTTLGEVALQPATGGVFVVEIVHRPQSQKERLDEDRNKNVRVSSRVLWDRKTDGGFPETKVSFFILGPLLPITHQEEGRKDGPHHWSMVVSPFSASCPYTLERASPLSSPIPIPTGIPLTYPR